MGECGCMSNERPIYRLDGPNNLTYVVKIYPSCDYCDSPAGVVIDLHTDEDLEMHGLKDVEKYEMIKNGKPVELGPAIPVIYRYAFGKSSLCNNSRAISMPLRRTTRVGCKMKVSSAVRPSSSRKF